MNNQDYNEGEQKIWRVGTLVYTAGGLMLLFAVLAGGDLFWLLRDRAMNPMVQILFKKHHATAFFNSVMVGTLPSVLGLIIGPIVCFWSDRYRGRFGRRIPFLFVTTPLAVAGIVGIGLSAFAAECLQALLPHWSHDALMLAVLSASWLFCELGVVVGNFIFTALVKDVVPTEFLGRFYGLFRTVSFSAGIVFNLWLIGLAKEHSMAIFLTLGALYGVAFALICRFVREGEYPPPPVSQAGATRTFVRESFGSPYYWMVFVLLSMLWTIFVPANAFLMFFVEALNDSGVMDNTAGLERLLAALGAGEDSLLFSVAGVRDGGVVFYGKCTALSFAVLMALAYPLGAVIDRFHQLRCLMVALAVAVVSYLVTVPFIDSKLTFAVALVAHNIVSGVVVMISLSLPLRLFPSARFAQFFTAACLVSSVFILAAIPLVGKFLDWTGNDYRHTFYITAGFAAATLLLCIVYYPAFKRRGGFDNYVAPEL